MILFFRRRDWLTHTRSHAEGKALDVGVACRIAECDRCCATQRAMDLVRHQWIVAGIDRD